MRGVTWGETASPSQMQGVGFPDPLSGNLKLALSSSIWRSTRL
jgi:hypothetical protein